MLNLGAGPKEHARLLLLLMPPLLAPATSSCGANIRLMVTFWALASLTCEDFASCACTPIILYFQQFASDLGKNVLHLVVFNLNPSHLVP